MATEDGGDVQRAEKFTLKRKLTGPPRLLLGKTRTRSAGEDRPEANKDRVENTESDAAKLTGTGNMDKKVSSVVTTESSGGRCGAAGEEDDIRNWKTSRRKWWRRFLPTALGNSKQKMDVKKGRRKQPSDGSVPPEGALQDTDADSLNNTEETTEHASKRKRGFDVRGWTTFKGFLTSERRMNKLKKDFVEKDGDESSAAFRKKLSRFFTRGGVRRKQTDGNRRASGVPLENVEDSPICEEASSAAHVDKPTKLHSDVTDGSLEVVTAEMSIQLMEEPAESPDETPTEEQPVCDVSVTEEDLTYADSEVIEGPKDTNKDSVKDLEEVLSSDADGVLDADQLSASSTSSHHTSELHCEEGTDQIQSLQPSTNRPSIWIELVPPDEDEEEERWETPNHLLLLLGFEHSEWQLVQTARSLVQAAMNAAVDQLTREQQSESDCIHREPPGCRDHA